MKHSALTSVKFAKLKRRLILTHWQCVGLLESIWLFAQTNAIAVRAGCRPSEVVAVRNKLLAAGESVEPPAFKGESL